MGRLLGAVSSPAALAATLAPSSSACAPLLPNHDVNIACQWQSAVDRLRSLPRAAAAAAANASRQRVLAAIRANGAVAIGTASGLIETDSLGSNPGSVAASSGTGNAALRHSATHCSEALLEQEFLSAL